MGKVTAELLRGARAGKPDALYELIDAIQERTQYKVSHLDIALEHLQLGQLPATYTRTDRCKSQVDAAIQALGCVAAAAIACTSSLAVRRSTTAKISEGFDGIIGWTDLLMRHWPVLYSKWKTDISKAEGFFRHISLLLTSLILLDDELAVAVFSSQRVLNAIQQLWSLEFETHSTKTTPIDKSCAVINLIANFAVHTSKEGEFHLLQALVSSPRFLSSFCDGISWRFRNTVTYHQHHKSNTDTAKRLNELAVIALLFDRPNLDPTILSALRLSGLFTSWIGTLLELQGTLNSRHVRFHIESAVLLATSRHGQPTHSVSAMLAAGFIPLFISVLPHLNWDDRKQVSSMLKIVQHLNRVTLFPRTARALHVALKPEYQLPSAMGKGIASGIIRQIWVHLWEGVNLVNRALTEPLRHTQHNPMSASSCESSGETPQCCPTCHLVVYCSKACQEDDWNQRHKSECRYMKRTLEGRRRETVHYSQANRHFHTQLLMEYFCCEYMSILDECKSGQRLPPNESILTIDASPGLDWPKAIGEVTLVKFATAFFGTFDSPEMEARKNEIINDFSGEPLSTTKRLISLVLFWDHHRRVHLLVEVVRDPVDLDQGSSYAVSRSVVTIEDTGSSPYKYESRYEVDMKRVWEKEKLHVAEG
ncbi:hypothetical protein BKA70DRAFT_1309051 [Coprinopsis sp. MPI-PUGE-AT-0042]|nr:hypothetical protein BKA70DRAFT_1309051 [Coprinopsis sp. MPI-PUGE-AT-0042]